MGGRGRREAARSTDPVGPHGPWTRLWVLFQVCEGKPLESFAHGRGIFQGAHQQHAWGKDTSYVLNQIAVKMWDYPSNPLSLHPWV